ncbi:unnamed protein product [marine sediment metagenome]|uniref:Uncharacterized protein n=1 Tax=marine sediment metagenome TaxID=412755 RepID=X1BCM0_9ZZZZ
MSWAEKMKKWGGADVTFLSEDGECITFMVVDEPYLIKGKYEGDDTQRIGCPAVTQEGFTLLVIGKRVARRLSKLEPYYKEAAFELIRHGEHGDQKSKYELTMVTDKRIVNELQAVKDIGVSAEDIADAVAEAEEICAGQ